MRRLSTVIAVVGAWVLAAGTVGLLTAATAVAQVAPPPPGAEEAPNTNLKVLPKDRFKTFGEILPVMQGIRDGLGVTCAYCHTYTVAWAPTNDFVSDAKPAKEKARAMMKMVQTINATIRAEIPPLDKPASTRQTVGVQCVTCHKGTVIPRELVDMVTETGNARGAASALTQYRELRQKHYGGEAYDFTDTTLFVAAQRANTANKPDDAIAYTQANVEFNPKSARSYQLMSQAYVKKMDTANAISAMEKAVAIDPMNMGFQNQLNQLKNPGQGRGGASR